MLIDPGQELPIVVISKSEFDPVLFKHHEIGNVFPVYCTYSPADNDSNQDYDMMTPNAVESVTTSLDEIESARDRLDHNEVKALQDLVQHLPKRLDGEFYEFQRAKRGLNCRPFDLD